ncbi:alkylated DNA repair protein alkB homolog 8 isoform X2 [Phalaenopsis equestris]|uniref:alkylated DNA repair protein alkB homolog 8 isoform X2 n=1 Tax=Phalaenopsis equestris TaxID=78828 RepID=UPI0009E46270|nr:alkylated DNA repair protein alkB homolog 8 isoform X2 [Phalaenopsis equestris]
MDSNLSRFTNPKGSSCSATQNLYVANCGPAVGISFEDIKSFFSTFGEVVGIHVADDSGTRVIVCYSELTAAEAAFRTLNGCHCGALGGRILHIRYSILQLKQKVNDNDSLFVSLVSSELAIPGIHLVHDFITSEEEQELLAAVDSKPWKNLSKRRVQHYGYEFLYEVNDYPPGIGLSPHIDTHSAFDDMICSLSLAGPCIMEFRKYLLGSCLLRKAIFLPPRSMLLLSGEGRYSWHHYIPHRKVDIVQGKMIRRCSKRVSFTFRKVRSGPCKCKFSQYCDSQKDI